MSNEEWKRLEHAGKAIREPLVVQNSADGGVDFQGSRDQLYNRTSDLTVLEVVPGKMTYTNPSLSYPFTVAKCSLAKVQIFST